MAMEVLFDIAHLQAAAAQMRQAQQTYSQAIDEVKAAAADLSSKWEGDGRDAFVADQEMAYQYYRNLCTLVLGIIDEIGKIAQRYGDHIAQLKSQM